ncbi:MAG: M23 family metallopeptidase [Oscillospiraceae bacterium]|nr:M23 family metallopeptidase [Oscillospiraceae bacterium]
MSNWKLCVSAFIFVFMTVLKLLFPDQTAEFRRQTVAFIDMDMDYRELVQSVGAYLTDDAVQSVSAYIPTRSENEEAVVHSPNSIVGILERHDSEHEISTDVLGRVEAFLAAQEAYAEYTLPDNVCYSNLTLPFSYISPVNGACASGFGYRVHPIRNEVLFHYGTDYDVAVGTEVKSFADGTVVEVGEESGYGNYVCVDHGNGWKTLYAHCSSISVAEGQVISMGDELALSGDTGRVTGPHLHFELMHEGMYTNPEFFLT